MSANDYSGRFGVILPAAGTGARFGGDKLAAVVAGRSVLEWSAAAFLDRRDVSAVVIVRDRRLPLPLGDEIARHPKLFRCGGGETRDASVWRGLLFLAARADGPAWLAVHDAARPLVSQKLIDRVFGLALLEGAAVPGVAVADTIKRVTPGVGFDGRRVVETPPRSQLVAVQTPQAMRTDWLLEAFAAREAAAAPGESPAGVTDDAQLLEMAGYRVAVAEGEAANLKVTTRRDLDHCEVTLRQRG